MLGFLRQQFRSIFSEEETVLEVGALAEVPAPAVIDDTIEEIEELGIPESLVRVLLYYTNSTGSKVAEINGGFIQFMDSCTDNSVKHAWATLCLHLDNAAAPEALRQMVTNVCQSPRQSLLGLQVAGCSDDCAVVLDKNGLIHDLKAYKTSPNILDNLMYMNLTSFYIKFTVKGVSHLENLEYDASYLWGKDKVKEMLASAVAVAKSDFDRINDAMGGKFADKIVSWSNDFLSPDIVQNCYQQLQSIGEGTQDLMSCSAFGAVGAFRALPFLIRGSKGPRIDYVYVDLAMKVKRPLDCAPAHSKKLRRFR